MAKKKCPECDRKYGVAHKLCSICGAALVYKNPEDAATAEPIGRVVEDLAPAAPTEATPDAGDVDPTMMLPGVAAPGDDSSVPLVPVDSPVPAPEPAATLKVPDDPAGLCSREEAPPVTPAEPSELAPAGRFALEVLDGTRAGERVALPASGGVILGSGPDAGVRLTGDDRVSRRHARVDVDEHGVHLTDTGSTNGTLLRVRDAVPLRPDDVFHLGVLAVRLREV